MSDARKTVFLAMPAYGQMTAGAAKGFFRASSGVLNVVGLQNDSSLLAMNANIGWCAALNRYHQGERLDYFAMIHSDVEPQDHWLDALVDELEAANLDVLGAVIPIKDQRGVTSTALARDDGDSWRVHSRLTMKEVYRLPATFTSDDVGRPLLINTGLWVCKWNQEWARQVHFTINDRICFDPKKGIYFAQNEPEDWFFSRLLHELGLRVGATRKIELGHRGTMSFGNHAPWGQNDHDAEYLTKSVLDRDDGEWFPHDAAGWLTPHEGKELARLADGKAVLEIGSYCGRSTICLAQRANSVGCVDTFDGRGTALPGDTFATFEGNVKKAGLGHKVTVYRGTSAEMLPKLPPVFDLVFIDGSHDRNSVAEDTDLAIKVLRPGGLLVYHDYGNPSDPGVKEAVDGLVGAELLFRCGSMAIVRPQLEVAAC